MRSAFILIGLLLLAPFALAQSVSLNIAPGYPQDRTYVFDCVANDFNATGFDWSFGDGTNVPGISGAGVLHTYVTNGDYTVACTGTDGNVNASQTLLVNVNGSQQNASNATNGTVDLSLSVLSPLAQLYDTLVPLHFITNVPSTMTYRLNGTETVGCSGCMVYGQNITPGPGQYALTAYAVTANESVNQSVAFGVFSTLNATPPSNQTGGASITVKDHYPQTGAYVLECNTPGFTPASYSWFYGDGMKSLRIHNQNVFHTYTVNGAYQVLCWAHDAQGNVVREATLDLSIGDIPRHNTCSLLRDAVATCEGGTVVEQDLGRSCRMIKCEGAGTERKVLVCDKPSADNPLYFEMYRADSNTNGLRICVLGSCVGPESGFAHSDLLVCDGNTQGNATNQTNGTVTPPIMNQTNGTGTNQTGNQTNGTAGNATTTASVSLAVAAAFPQGNNVVLVCSAEGFAPTSYSWEFGDSQMQTTATDNVYHTYPGEGEYEAACTATYGNITRDDNLVVTIDGPANNGTSGNAT
jgi:plastocyanin